MIEEMTITQLKRALPDWELTSELVEKLKADSRKGVRQLGQSCERKLIHRREERERLSRMMSWEKRFKERGFTLVAGLDEAGRGPLAGPVVAAAVVLPANCSLWGLTDSKSLQAKKREEFFSAIHSRALGVGVGLVEPATIDCINILQASLLAMYRAVRDLEPVVDCLLLDGKDQIPYFKSLHQQTLIEGESKSASIAAASILAKVTRDRIMVKADEDYPGYGFARHKGYPTTEHLQALRERGSTPIHRRSFRGVEDNS